MKHTPEEIEQLKLIIKNYIAMPHECREKYLIYGEGMLAGSKLKEA